MWGKLFKALVAYALAVNSMVGFFFIMFLVKARWESLPVSLQMGEYQADLSDISLSWIGWVLPLVFALTLYHFLNWLGGIFKRGKQG